MPEYRAIYKCRMCGEEYSDAATGEMVAMALTVALTVKDSTENVRYNGNHLCRHGFHACKDGSFGFSDFIGMRKVE